MAVRALSTSSWGLVGVAFTLGTAAAAGLHAPTVEWIVMAVLATACLAAAGIQHGREGQALRAVAVDRVADKDDVLGMLLEARRDLIAVAGTAATLDPPVDSAERVAIVVGRYNALEMRVALLLAESDDLDPECEDKWRRDPEWHSPDVYPMTGELLKRMADLIGYRIALLARRHDSHAARRQPMSGVSPPGWVGYAPLGDPDVARVYWPAEFRQSLLAKLAS